MSTDSRSIKIAFAMSVIAKVGEFLNTLTMQYELRYKWWINDFICASLSLLIILLSEYHYVPIRKIKLCCWNLGLKWRSRFSYKVAGNAVLSGHSAAGLQYWNGHVTAGGRSYFRMERDQLFLYSKTFKKRICELSARVFNVGNL